MASTVYPSGRQRLPLSSLSGCPRGVQPRDGRFGPRGTPLDRGAFSFVAPAVATTGSCTASGASHSLSTSSAGSIPILWVAENGTTATCAALAGNDPATARAISSAAAWRRDDGSLSIFVASTSAGRPLDR